MLETMDHVFEAWHTKKLADFVAKPPKWLRSNPYLHVGDVVIFQKCPADQVMDSPMWTIG